MSNLPVLKAVSVLETFRAQKDQGLWVNKIFDLVNKKTGSKDKPAIIKGVEYLEQAAMLESHLVNKQKTLKNLSPLGKEIVNLMNDLEDYSKKYTQLKNMIISYNFTVGTWKSQEDGDKREQILKNKLLNIGFDARETESFQDMMRCAFDLEAIYRKNILNCILARYSNILSKYDSNDKASNILMNIMMKAISEIFILTQELQTISSTIFASSKKYYSTKYEFVDRLPFMDTQSWVLQEIEEFYYEVEGRMKKEAADIMTDLTLSTLMLLQPDIEDIKTTLSDSADLERQLSSSVTYGKKKLEDRMGEISHPVLLRIYKKYLEQMSLRAEPSN